MKKPSITVKPAAPLDPIAGEWATYAAERSLEGSTGHRHTFMAGVSAAVLLLSRKRVPLEQLQRELAGFARVGVGADA